MDPIFTFTYHSKEDAKGEEDEAVMPHHLAGLQAEPGWYEYLYGGQEPGRCFLRLIG